MPTIGLDRYVELQRRIERAARAAGRAPADVRLVAVTKGRSAEEALALFARGQRDFGESRPQELETKRAAFARALGPTAAEVRWHLVGHLQKNKVRRALEGLFALHSFDRAGLVDVVRDATRARAEPLRVFLQVKVLDDPSKGGLSPVEVPGIAGALAGAPGIALRGLMAIAPWRDDADARGALAREAFAGLARLASTLDRDAFEERRVELSIGMSGDLEAAIAAGADWVRVGGALFRDEEAGA